MHVRFSGSSAVEKIDLEALDVFQASRHLEIVTNGDIHDQGFVTSAEQMPKELVPPI
jgi:hypothetical protein